MTEAARRTQILTCSPVRPTAPANAMRSARVGVGVTSNASDNASVTRTLNLPEGVPRATESTAVGEVSRL